MDMRCLLEFCEPFIKLSLACLLGALVGYERQVLQKKTAGIRTNSLVCIGACLVMMLSREMGALGADPARLASQVVSGVGFLGAGFIIKRGATVTGLTTAACLWVVAAIGLAIGKGNYSYAIFAAILVFVVLIVFEKFEQLGKAKEHKEQKE